MDDFRGPVLAQVNTLSTRSQNLLRRTNKLRSLIQRLLIEEATRGLIPSDDLLQQVLATHCKENSIDNENKLKTWLEEACLSREELLFNLSLPIRHRKLAFDCFAEKAEAQFLQRKEELDQVTYSLLRVKDSGLAHELYLQLEAGESTFDSLAKKYSEGPEQRSGGRVGPTPISRAHPQLQQLLRTASIGVILGPILIEQWWVVARLDERMEASFDDAMRQRMATELLEEWITTETNHLVKEVCNRENGQ
jgi:hypothetical protein